MNKGKLENANIYFGIDTLQVKSDTESALTKAEAPFISKIIIKDTDTGSYYYKLNPDKANNGLQIYNGYDYYATYDSMINKLNLTNPVKTRIDFRVDSFDNNFNDLLKLNKLLILLIAEKYKVKNRYQSKDPLTQEELCVRIQNDRIEVENYNKAIQEPEDDVQNRIEFRSKKLYDDSAEHIKEYLEFANWCNRLDKAVTKEIFSTLQNKINQSLYERYYEQKDLKGFTINEFLYKYQGCIFTSKQLADLYRLFGYKDPEQQAKKYKRRKHIEYFSFTDLRQYVKKIKESGQRFFEYTTEY